MPKRLTHDSKRQYKNIEYKTGINYLSHQASRVSNISFFTKNTSVKNKQYYRLFVH